MLYECLGGTPPFRRPTEVETLWAHMQEDPPPLHGRQRLDPVLGKALAKERDDRYGTCRELTEEAGGALGLTAPLSARRRLSRAALLLVLGGLLLGAAAVIALTRSESDNPSDPARLLDIATNSVGAVDVRTEKLALAAPLAGRPIDVATGDGTAWVASVDSTAVTGVSGRTRSILRTVPLAGSADAIGVGEGSVWVADGRRGVLSRIKVGYERVAQRIRYPRGPNAAAQPTRLRPPWADAVVVDAGAVWVTNGSQHLTRIDPSTGRVRKIRTGRRLTGLARGAGALWAISSGSATLLRVDPRTAEVTDRIPIVVRRGAAAPFPFAVAATPRAVWVLNGNAATVTRIDPRTRRVAATIPIGVDRVPADIAAEGRTAWVANGDGSLSRIDVRGTKARSIWIGESLERVAAEGSRVWITTTAFDQKLPGGAG